MNKVGGGSLPAEIWHDIMLTTVKDTPAGAPKYPPMRQSKTNIGTQINVHTSHFSGNDTKAQKDEKIDEEYDAIGALIELTD